MQYILDYRYVGQLLELDPIIPGIDAGPKIILTGIRLPDRVSRDLKNIYGAVTAPCDPPNYATLISNSSYYFVMTEEALHTPLVYQHLWRAAKEGAKVLVLHDSKCTTEPKPFNTRNHGFKSYDPGIMSCFPYSVGIIRKDLAEHFHR